MIKSQDVVLLMSACHAEWNTSTRGFSRENWLRLNFVRKLNKLLWGSTRWVSYVWVRTWRENLKGGQKRDGWSLRGMNKLIKNNCYWLNVFVDAPNMTLTHLIWPSTLYTTRKNKGSHVFSFSTSQSFRWLDLELIMVRPCVTSLS